MFGGTLGDIIIGPAYIEVSMFGNTYCLGYTIGGISIKPQTIYNELTKMDTIGIYDYKKVSESILIKTVLSEASLDHLKLVWAGYSEVSSTCFYGGDDVSIPGIGLKFIGPGPNCIRREVTIWRVVAYDVGEYIAVGSQATVLPIVFKGVQDMARVEGKRLYMVCDYPERQFNLLEGIEE